MSQNGDKKAKYGVLENGCSLYFSAVILSAKNAEL